MAQRATSEIYAKSILVKSKLPDADYVVNPYTGCQFGCAYCYASFMGRFVDQPISNWGNYLHPKVNSVELFRSELSRIRRRGETPSLFLSSVTDPYQGPEKKYRLTRGILEVLSDEPYPGRVSILTKSPLVLRDIDLFRRLPQIEVGLTVTSTDDEIAQVLESHAPPSTSRVETLSELHAEGIETYAFVGPLLPHFRYAVGELEEIFRRISVAGVRTVYVEHLNLKPYILERIIPTLDRMPKQIREVYLESQGEDHRAVLDREVRRLLKHFGISLRLNELLYHNSSKGSSYSDLPVQE